MSSKTREALLAVYDCAKDGVLAIRESAFEKVVEALTEPIRNCDVGTEHEQSDRFAEFCRYHQEGCGLGYGSKGIGHPKVTCPAFKDIECSIVWAQMPYESEVK